MGGREKERGRKRGKKRGEKDKDREGERERERDREGERANSLMKVASNPHSGEVSPRFCSNQGPKRELKTSGRHNPKHYRSPLYPMMRCICKLTTCH